MKDKKSSSFGVGGGAPTTNSLTNINGVMNNNNNNNNNNKALVSVGGAVIRRRKKQQHHQQKNPQQGDLLIIRRLKEYFLYSKLKSLIPPPNSHHQMITDHEADDDGPCEGAAEMELEPHECLINHVERSDSADEINRLPRSTTTTTTDEIHYKEKKDDDDVGWGNWCNVEYEREDIENGNDEEKCSSSSSSSRVAFTPSIKIWRMEDSIQISTVVEKEVSLTSTLFGVLEEEKLDIVFENQYRTETKVAHTIQVRLKPGYDIDAFEKKLRTWAGYSTKT